MGYSKSIDYVNPVNWFNFIHGSIIKKESIKSHQVIPAPLTMNFANVAGNIFIKVAGISGALAVAMGAYGSHGLYPNPNIPLELKEVYKTANFYHFVHTLALLSVPFTRRPILVGSLISTGMLLFCGTCYFYALTGNKSVVRATPYGGSLLIIAWLTMLLP